MADDLGHGRLRRHHRHRELGLRARLSRLEAEFGWSRAEVSGIPSVGIFVVAAGAPLVGWWVDRWGVRTAFLAGAVSSGLCLAALAYAEELWQFYLLYGLASFFRTLTSYIPLVAVVSRWFPDKRGGPLGLLLAGVGVGGVISHRWQRS